MTDSVDDSGYISNSLGASTSWDCPRPYSVVSQDQSLNQNKNAFDTYKDAFTCTSTPYAVLNEDDIDSCEDITPSRKRKNTWIHDSCVDDSTPYTRQKRIATRKLFNGSLDGSASDTDLEISYSKKVCVEGSKSEPSSPQRNALLNSPHCKLGSIEKNQVLYPKLVHRAVPRKYKLSTPSKIRQQVKEEHTPRISQPSQRLTSFIRASHNVDLFTLFTVRSSNLHILENIFSYLEPDDIVSLYHVSKVARACIYNIPHLNVIRKNYLREKNVNKENVCSTPSPYYCKKRPSSEHRGLSTTSDNLTHSIGSLNLSNSSGKGLMNINPVTSSQHSTSAVKTSPRKREWMKFVEASAELKPGEKLTRCSSCSNPARVINHVVICRRRGCQYVCCTMCCDPLCLSVQYFDKIDINDIAKLNEVSSVPECSGSEASVSSESTLKPRQLLAECSNSNVPKDGTGMEQLDNANNNTEPYNSMFSSTFNFNIETSEKTEMRHIPKTVSDLVHHKESRNRTYVNRVYVPDSPPKVTKPIAISSKISKKNLRRL